MSQLVDLTQTQLYVNPYLISWILMSDINFYNLCTFSSVYYLNYCIFLNLVKCVIFIDTARFLKHVFYFTHWSCLKCLWSEIFFFVFLSLVMSTFRNCQTRVMLKREKSVVLPPKVNSRDQNSGSGDWKRVYKRWRRKLFQRFVYLTSPL